MRKKAAVEGPKKLTASELSTLHTNDLENKNAKLEIIVEQKNLELTIMKQKMMGQEIALMQNRIKNLCDQQASRLEKKREFVKTLTKKHNLAEGWGFDPESGEIKEEHV